VIATEAEARALVAELGEPGSVQRCEHLLALLADENTRQNLVFPFYLGTGGGT